jgi:sensor histidine kinase YesM
MKTKQNTIRRHLLNVISVLVISLIITFLFAGFDSDYNLILLNVAYGALIGLSIASGCSAISNYMLRSDKWLDNPIPRYISTILLVSLFLVVDVLVINTIWFKITQDRSIMDLFKINFFILILSVEFTVGLLIYLIMLSKHFAQRLNAYHVANESARAQVEKYKFETLKNQVNPHFLFNSLNVLSGMIYTDLDKADEFITRLASIYRYVLDMQENEIVELSQELKFAEDYLFLLQLRHGENLQYKIQGGTEGYVVPMAMQIVLENVLKHNSISDSEMLQIRISVEKDYVQIQNNRLPISGSVGSGGLGLQNIQKRYEFLTDKLVLVSDKSDFFTVQIPLLKTK